METCFSINKSVLNIKVSEHIVAGINSVSEYSILDIFLKDKEAFLSYVCFDIEFSGSNIHLRNFFLNNFHQNGVYDHVYLIKLKFFY